MALARLAEPKLVVFRFLCQVYFFDLKTDHQMSKRAEVYGGVAGL